MKECAWCGDPVGNRVAAEHNGDPCHADCLYFLEHAAQIEKRGMSFEGVL